MANSAAPSAGGGPPGALPPGYARGEGGRVRPVYVQLSKIYLSAVAPRDDEAPAVQAGSDAPVPPGQHGRLDLRLEVIGRLHYWERDSQGNWYGIVDYSVPLVGDFRPAKPVDCGLVPAAALRPRELGAPDGQPRHAP